MFSLVRSGPLWPRSLGDGAARGFSTSHRDMSRRTSKTPHTPRRHRWAQGAARSGSPASRVRVVLVAFVSSDWPLVVTCTGAGAAGRYPPFRGLAPRGAPRSVARGAVTMRDHERADRATWDGMADWYQAHHGGEIAA